MQEAGQKSEADSIIKSKPRKNMKRLVSNATSGHTVQETESMEKFPDTVTPIVLKRVRGKKTTILSNPTNLIDSNGKPSIIKSKQKKAAVVDVNSITEENPFIQSTQNNSPNISMNIFDFGGRTSRNETVEDDVSLASDSDNEDSNSTASDDSDIENSELEIHVRKSDVWQFEKSFATRLELDEFLKKETCWSYRSVSNSTNGQKTWYRCNKVKRLAKVQCEAGIYVIEHQEFFNQSILSNEDDLADDVNRDTEINTTYLMYRKEASHTHQRSLDKTSKISERVQKAVIRMWRSGMKPKKISYELLDSEDIPTKEVPTYKRIMSFINNFKKREFGGEPITMRQLLKFVSKHTTLPDQPDVAFIVDYEHSPRNQKEDKYFRIFISTRRLLSNAVNSINVHADATHKVCTEKIPLIAVGVTDHNSSFHFVGMSLSTYEKTDDFAFNFNAMRKGVTIVTSVQLHLKTLICDADPAIHNGFRKIYPESTQHPHLIIMCYFHVILNIRTKYKFAAAAKNKPKFIEDVRKLHLCDSERKFDAGCRLFVKKWIDVEYRATKTIRKSFFKKNKNWYIGVAPRVPKHNNGMENFNSTMKRCQTQHQRQPLKQFLNTALAIVRQRSKEYIKDKLPFADNLTVSSEMKSKGKSAKTNYVHTKESHEVNFYTFRSELKRRITLDNVIAAEGAVYDTFNDFNAKAFDIWKISFPIDGENWMHRARCTCPSFDLNYICKHIISIAISCDIFKDVADSSSEDYDDEPLFVSKRGRPKRSSKALVRE